jgi:hypothetical protein
MRTHTYSRVSAATDLARSGIGLFLSGTPLLIVDDRLHVVTAILLCLVVVFVVGTVRALLRARTRVEWDNSGIQTRDFRTRHLQWGDIRSVKLAYYSTRRDRSDGWMHLNIANGTTTLRFDSNLDSFKTLVDLAASAATRNDVSLDAATQYNLSSIGISIDDAWQSAAIR